MRYLSLLSFSLLALLTACQQKAQVQETTDTTEENAVASIDTSFELEEIDTLDITWSMDFNSLYGQLSERRYVGFPIMMHNDPRRWCVSNETYGAYKLCKALGKDELIDTLIDWRINKYIRETKTKLPKLGDGNDYEDMEQFVFQFLPTDSTDIDLDEMGQNDQLKAIYKLYLSYFFISKVNDIPENKKIANILEMERLYWRLVKRTQNNLMKAVFEGNAPQKDQIELANSQNTAKIKADIDFYYTLTRKNYATSDTIYEKMTDQFAFYDVYNAFIRDIKATGKIGISKQFRAMEAEQKAWMSYIYTRNSLSSKLSKPQQAIYNNATNRLQKWHIVQLKNRFKGYGYCSPEFKSSLLKDDCTYQELYKYVPMKLDAQF